jgi:hypothetical protein
LNNNQQLKHIEAPLSKFINVLLDYISKNNLHLKFQSLELILSITNKQLNTVKGLENNIFKSLLSQLNEDNVQIITFIYDIFYNLFEKTETSLIQKSVEDTLTLLSSHKVPSSGLNSIFNYLEKGASKINKKDTEKYIDKLLSNPLLNLNEAKLLAILAVSAGLSEQLIKKQISKVSHINSAWKQQE